MTFKPMLACNADLSKLKFPVLASPKFDGIRCVVLDGKALSRNLKPIANKYVRNWLETHCEGLDGELVVGEPTAQDCFQKTTSAVMSKDGEPMFCFYVFDWACSDDADCIVPFSARLEAIAPDDAIADEHMEVVPHSYLTSMAQLEEYEAQKVAEGWEGVMLRDPYGVYKHGRSTAREGGLLKVKRFADAEAIVVGFEERMHNGNVATVDALGHTKRTTHAENKKGLGDLGALVVERHVPDEEDRARYDVLQRFTIGTGFTQAQRTAFWTQREALLGQRVTFKYQEVGSKDAPRFPVFKAFRPEGA